MRLLVLSTWWPDPPDNGSRMRAFHLLRGLGRRHTITLVAFGAPADPSACSAVGSVCERVIGLTEPCLAGGRLGLRGLLSPVPRYHAQTESPAMLAIARSLTPGHDAVIGLQISAARYLAELPSVPRVFEEVEVTAIRERWAQKSLRPIDYFKKFYGDTVLGGSTAALRCGLEFFGPERVVFASDFPYGPESGLWFLRENLRSVDEVEVSERERDGIYFGNALKLIRKRLPA